MTENLFSHRVDTEHVTRKSDDPAKNEGTTEPVAHPVFSDKSR